MRSCAARLATALQPMFMFSSAAAVPLRTHEAARRVEVVAATLEGQRCEGHLRVHWGKRECKHTER